MRSLSSKSGVASFYIVAFSTLILAITVASFATVVISQIARTANEDLSQSAYDSALAGIEDAKIAYSSYQACLKAGNYDAEEPVRNENIGCEEIIWWMQNYKGCDLVPLILGKIKYDDDYNEDNNNEIPVNESGSDNNMDQAYTCVKINTTLSDYRASLSSSNARKIIKVNLDKVDAKDIAYIKLSWYSNREGEIYNYTNVINSGTSQKVAFPSLKNTKAATPPTISLDLIQTSAGFTVDELYSSTRGSRTDRATLYLVPTDDSTAANQNYNPDNSTGTTGSTLNNGTTYIGAYSGSGIMNNISRKQVVSTNDLQKNLPFLVYCPDAINNTGAEFACTTTIELPKPIGDGERNSNTFMLMVSLPYEQPDTDFAIEFICNGGSSCLTENIGEGTGKGAVDIENMQVEIDSTGRANDLFRRIEVRMESTDSTFHYPIYAIEAGGTPGTGGTGGTAGIEKNLTVASEYGSTSAYDDYLVEPNWPEDPEEPAEPAEPGTDIDSVQYMQDFATMSATQKQSVLNSMTTGTQCQLTDNRDNKVYYVSKLADGNVWMTQNLDHDIVTTPDFYTYYNTDIGHGNTINTNATWTGANNSRSYNLPDWYNPGNLCWNGTPGNSAVGECNSSNIHYHLGNYYNFTAAVAMSNSEGKTGDVNQSICPAGWMLPKNGTGYGSFGNLIDDYGWNGHTSMSGSYQMWDSPLFFTLGGLWDGGFWGVGSSSNYWSSVVESIYDSDLLYLNYNGYAYPTYGYRDRVFSVRCVLR